MKFRYNYEKNAKLVTERGIGFDEIIQSMADGNILSITDHPNASKYPSQKIIYVKLLDEVYIVPFVIEEDGTLFLKTLFPSRKARKLLLANIVQERE